MKIFIHLVTIFVLLESAQAINCNSAPQGKLGGTWWRKYSAWCTACGGTPYQGSGGGGCRPGPNWGGRNRSNSGGSSNYGTRGRSVGNQMIYNAVQEGMNQLFRQPTPQELAAKRQREWAAEQARIAAEIERQRLIKEKNDRMDAEANETLSLIDEAPSAMSDEDLLAESPVTTASLEEKKFDCTATVDLINRLKDPGLKHLDINIGKTEKIIKQAEVESKSADREAAIIAGNLLAGKLADKMANFASNQKTILAMEKQLMKLRKRKSTSKADIEKLQKWISAGITGGNGVMDAYEKTKAAKAFDFSDPKNTTNKEQMLTALGEFNAKFMADTGAWELAGETLAKTLGPGGVFAFKSAVLGIKVTVNRGNKMIAVKNLNEQKYLLGSMMKTRSEMSVKVNQLTDQYQTNCPGK